VTLLLRSKSYENIDFYFRLNLHLLRKLKMLRCSVKFLMEGVQNTSKTNRGCVFTKALSTKTSVVIHDEVNRMFYIQVDNGMVATAITHFCAKGPTALPCIQDSILFFLARNCPTAEIVHVYMKRTEEKKIKPQGSLLPKHAVVLCPDNFTSLRKVYCHVTLILEVMIHVLWLIFNADIIREPG